MHQISTAILLCECIQILSNFNLTVSHAKNIMQPCNEITKVGLKENFFSSEIKNQEKKLYKRKGLNGN